MLITFCKSKIGHATITEANLQYEGSITVPSDLLEAVNILPGEQVHVLNVNNGERFTTYAIAGPAGSGHICLNGPAARLGLVGDVVMVLSYGLMTPEEAKDYQMKIIHLDARNQIKP